MPPRDPNDYKYWRDQAAELRAKAETYENEFAAHAVRRIADKYDHIADRAEERIIHGIDAPTSARRPKINGTMVLLRADKERAGKGSNSKLLRAKRL